MLSIPKQTRRLSITAAQIGDAAPPLDQLVRWSASIQLGKRPKFKDWVLDGQPTGSYTCAKPTYKFSPNFNDAREHQRVSTIVKALEQCFGLREPSWTIWIMGDELMKCMRDFRTTYIKIEKDQVEDLHVLDDWVEHLYAELKRM